MDVKNPHVPLLFELDGKTLVREDAFGTECDGCYFEHGHEDDTFDCGTCKTDKIIDGKPFPPCFERSTSNEQCFIFKELI